MSARPEVKDFVAPPLRYHWEDDAACLTADPDLFSAPDRDDDTDDTAARRYAKAAAGYCHRCTVRPECLTRQLAAEPPGNGSHGRHGIAGGLTPAQRAEPALRDLVLSGLRPPMPKAGSGPPRKRRKKPAAAAERPASKPCGHCGKPVTSRTYRDPDATWWHNTAECRRARKQAITERADAARKARIAEWAAKQQAAA